MNKADFVRRVVEQFNSIASAAKRQAEAEIEEADQRLTFDPFCAWLERRHDRARRYPFSRDLKPARAPRGAARAFADVIALDAEAETDWAEHWEQAAPILANRQPEASDGWKFGHYLRCYIAAVRGHACASAFDRRLSKGEELAKKVVRGEIAGSKEYQSTWRYWKGILKDSDLTEARYLEAEIDETEERIRGLESGADKGDKELLRLQREKLRVFKRRLEGLEALEEGTAKDGAAQFFHSIEAEQKAFAAARLAGLTDETGNWSFTGYKTHAVSLFWVAAIRAGLAKPTAPVSKVSPFLSEIFDIPLGLNAINKKKKAEEYDRGTDDTVYQRLYNELLTKMGK